MVKGLGLDLCEIRRMEKQLADERFLNRYFTREEISYIRGKGKSAAQTMAGIFAAKEALSKALGTGIAFDLKEICVTHDPSGKPAYSLSGKVMELGDGDRFLARWDTEPVPVSHPCFPLDFFVLLFHNVNRVFSDVFMIMERKERSGTRKYRKR